MFTDIEGSTRLWEERPDEMRSALAEHDVVVRGAIDAHDGYVFSTGGDGFAVAFSRAGDAVDAAVQAQAALAGHRLIRVRMGLHTGEVQERGGDYFGPPVNRAARLMAIGHGGQVLASAATESLLDGTVERRDLGEHRLRDLSAPQRVFQLGDGSFPALRSVDAVPSNLPTVLTELVGRRDDIAELSRRTRIDRILTLTGTGGVGKTRLSLAVAAAVASEFFDGVWFVELAPVADAAGIERAVASALGVGATTDIGQAGLVNYLRGRRLVLVLDNCEHVLDDAADFVTAVVAGAPDVHVVATSREPLGVDGEVVRRVRSLGLPDDDADAAAVAASDAVRMFVERATAVNDEFRLNAGNRAAVVEICRKLDGIPLAIELAAARVRGMTPTQIAGRLDERFRLLSGARRAQERHRTLQAAVSWSYELLSPDEQRVFWRLSVFPASFDDAAAQAVAGDAVDVFDDLLRLVDRSLVQHDLHTGRYRLLETLRQFGSERAVDAGEGDEIRDRYIDYYVALLTEVGPRYEDARGFATAAVILIAELDNIAAVAALLVGDARWRQLHNLCCCSAGFLVNHAPANMARWLDIAVQPGSCIDADERADALGRLAYAAFNGGAIDLAAGFATRSMDLSSSSEGGASPWALWTLGTFGQLENRFDESLAYFDAAVAAAAHHNRYTRLLVGAGWLLAFLRVHGYEGNDGVIDDALQKAKGHPVAYAVMVTSASNRALGVERDLDRGRGYLDTVTDSSAAGSVLEAWINQLRAMALTDHDPRAAVGYAIEAVRVSDRAGSAFAMYTAFYTLAALAVRIGRPDLTIRLNAHLEALPDVYRRGSSPWLNIEIDAALADAGIAIPVIPHELTRQELFAIIAELEASV